MAWDFSTEPEFQEKLEWIRAFVRDEAEPLELAFGGEGLMYDKKHPVHDEVVRPLQQQVKAQGLWACHLGSDLGGKGYGQVKLALMAEILGRCAWAPSLFGCQAPDSGNAEILAHYGSDEQKERYLEPLLEQRIVSCYSMTEPHAGSDPRLFNCRAERDGDDWVINGEKFFSSNLRYADFAIVMAITNPDVPVYQGASMLLVPTDTPGLQILRHTGVGTEPEGTGNHPHVRYENVRVPGDALLGGEGQAFAIAQTRLGGGRLHHAMRTVGAVQKCFDMMRERAVSRRTTDGLLADKQMVREAIADSWVQILQFRLQVLHAAWTCDRVGGSAARAEIAGVKVATAKVYHDVVIRALHLHGALGVSNEMPFTSHLLAALSLGIADGPTEVHKLTIAKAALKGVEPAEGLWPTGHLPARRAEARRRFAHLLEHEVGNQ